jgi:dephospho-CoA kinase
MRNSKDLPPVLVVTGNVGSGKSTAGKILEELGGYRIDSDGVAHWVISREGPAYASVVERFGKEILLEDGSIDRRALGKIVFSDPEKKKVLEELTHPWVLQKIQEELMKAKEKGVPFVVLEIPLFFEGGLDRYFPYSLLLTAKEEIRKERILKRDKLSLEEVTHRLRSQMKEEEKIPRARYWIRNEGTVEELRKNIEDVLKRFLSEVRSSP